MAHNLTRNEILKTHRPFSAQQAGQSELEKENLNYVAAAPAQIKEVLIKDPGPARGAEALDCQGSK